MERRPLTKHEAERLWCLHKSMEADILPVEAESVTLAKGYIQCSYDWDKEDITKSIPTGFTFCWLPGKWKLGYPLRGIPRETPWMWSIQGGKFYGIITFDSLADWMQFEAEVYQLSMKHTIPVEIE